jgi:glyoxylate reductase
MTAKRPRAIVTRRLPDPAEARLAELVDVRLNREDAPFDAERLAQAVRDCDILVPAVTDRIDSAVIGQASDRLKLIASFGAGTDHIDLDTARERGIAVTNTPDVLTEDTADLVMALILTVPRRLGAGERMLRAGEWRGWGPTDFLGASLTGMKLGIVGMGRIGRAVARRARACGMEVHYHNRRPVAAEEEEALGARWWGELDAMLGTVEMVTVNAPYGPETHHLIDARRLGLMKPGAFLINAARGGLVDQEALIAGLESGRLGGAGLDVYPDEPAVDPRLLALANAVLLPHMGSATIEGRTAMGMKVVANIEAWMEGRELPDRVA